MEVARLVTEGYQRASATRDTDWPEYPQLKAEFGEDPGRFLYGMESPMPRIKALTDEDLLRAYLRVEAEHEAREEIISALNKRQAVLRGELDSMDASWGIDASDGDATAGRRQRQTQTQTQTQTQHQHREQPGEQSQRGLKTGDHDPSPVATEREQTTAPSTDDTAGGSLAGDPHVIAELIDVNRAADLLEAERARDDPREAVLNALEARLDDAD